MELRMTHQREIILQELQTSREHLTADELYERVKKGLPRISLATVYRNLEILNRAGLIAKREVSGRQKRFDYDVSDHDHIFCIQCHRIDNLDLKREEIGYLPLESLVRSNEIGKGEVNFIPLQGFPKALAKVTRIDPKEVEDLKGRRRRLFQRWMVETRRKG
jgi:Fur family ferric uptake transcriptional regulator